MREIAGAGAASRTNHVDVTPDPERAVVAAGAVPSANHVDAADPPGRVDAGCQPGRGDVERSAPRPPAGIGHPHPERAAQFKPFAALRGYYELVSACERVVEPRPVLSEEESRELSERLLGLSLRMRARRRAAPGFVGGGIARAFGAVARSHPRRGGARGVLPGGLHRYANRGGGAARYGQPNARRGEKARSDRRYRIPEVVRVAYYQAGSIVTQTGAVGQLDTVSRTLAVVRKRVPIDDIVSLERSET